MMGAANICHACRKKTVVDMLDCGPQPVCNRFLVDPTATEATFPLVISQCDSCGLIQIHHPAAVEEIRPRWDWIGYNEPEGHLDALVEELASLPQITRESLIGAIVFGGDTTIARFRQRGFQRTWRIDLQRDLGVSDRNAGTETIQERLTPESAGQIARQHGQFDLLVVRHMVEHAHDVRRFLAAIHSLLKPGGLAVFEVPDCEQAFATCDYSILWEEHVFYFMPVTFRHCLEAAGFGVMAIQRPAYSLVALTRAQSPAAPTKHVLPAEIVAQEKARMRSFAQSLPGQRDAIGTFLVETRAQKGPIAFFGAGHLACVYINLLQMKEHLDCIVDDHPRKRGLFLPGSRLPIVGSASLVERGIKVCLSPLSPETEAKVASNNPEFIASGGRFASIFSGRPNSLPIRSCA